MFKKLTRVLKNNSGLLVLFLLVFLISLLNYSSNTWLSGWDNLHPEFNFSLNIKRSFFSVWQEYQGLGLLGGMGHASDLFRQIFLWLNSFALPTYFLRYFFHLLMLFLGPLGLYFLLKNIVFNQFEKQKESASLIGAIFYLLNLATLQMFYVPFEAYSTHFAFLPWLFLVNLNFLEKGSKKSFLLLLLINLLAISQGYVATYFLVYFIILSAIFFSYFLSKKRGVKKILVAYLILLSVNAFWLLPNLYFALTSSGINASAKINQMSTETNFLLNHKYGDFTNVAFLKGFWFENTTINEGGKLVYLMGNWVNHLKNPLILIIGYSLFTLSLLGIISAFIKKAVKVLIFIPVFLISFIFLANNTPVVSQIANLFYKVPIFYQIFRFPYTKFAVISALCLSIFYAFFFLFISNLLKKPIIKKVLLILFVLLPIIILYPVFQGNLFYEKNQVKIPQEYFQVFSYFNDQPKNTRIANFPQNTYWGWNKYQWGYSGSGFLWYGIEQPILDRAFDVWSDKDENYYWEISYALYSKNRELFENVLEKYQINWLLVDGNVINPSSPKALYFDELEEMISKSDKISLTQEFGKIKIFEVNLETPVKDFVFLAENLPVVGPNYQWNNYDHAYSELGSYLTNYQLLITNNQTYFPFRSLFTGRSQTDLEFEVEDRGEHFVFKKSFPESLKNYQLIIPEETQELVWVDPQDLSKVRYLKSEVKIKDNAIEVIVPKVNGFYGAEIDPTKEPSVQKAINCQEYLGGQVTNEIVKENSKNFLRLTAEDAKNCGTTFWLPNLNHGLAYLITVENRNIKGKSLLFWLENLNSRRADLETYLPKLENGNSKFETSFFIQPPMEEDGLGYTLHFDNLSIGRVESMNDLGKITVNPIPFKFLTGLKLISPEVKLSEPKLSQLIEVSHPNPSYYKIQLSAISYKPSAILVLSQAYHDGWLAWEGKPFIGKRLHHIKINNWENGWILNGDQLPITNNQLLITLLFWPQLLEYFGFILLGGTLLGVGIYCLRKK